MNPQFQTPGYMVRPVQQPRVMTIGSPIVSPAEVFPERYGLAPNVMVAPPMLFPPFPPRPFGYPYGPFGYGYGYPYY